MRLSRSLLVMGCLLLCAAPGCQSKEADPVLATVGPRKITLSDYRTAYASLVAAKAQPDTAADGWQTKMLQDLINKELMEQEGQRRMPELDDSQKRRLRRFAEGQIMNLLNQAEVMNKAVVTDADVKRVYDRYDRQVYVRHILTETETQIRDLEKELTGGADWKELAVAKSLDWESGKKGGDLGWVKPLQMVEPFEAVVFDMKPGQQSAPFRTRFGWHIVRCDSLRTVDRPELSGLEEVIRSGLAQERGLGRQEQFQKGIMDAAKPENQPETLALLDKKFVFEVPAEQSADPYAKLNLQREIPSFTADELKLPVVKFADRAPFTVQDFNEALGWMPPGVWPSGQGVDEIEEALKQMIRTKLLKEKATELGLDKSPEYVALIKKKENEIRVNSLYYNEIQGKVDLSDTDLRNYFEAHRQQFLIRERASLSRMETANSDLAQRAAAAWRAGKSHDEVEALVRREDSKARTTAETTDPQFMTPRGNEPDLDEVVYSEATKIGDVVGPTWVPGQGGGRWVVARVLDRQPERVMTYDEASEFVKQSARNAAADEALKKLLDELKKRFPVKINDKTVAGLRPADVAAVGS